MPNPRLLFITVDRSASTYYRMVMVAEALKRAGYVAEHGMAGELHDLTLNRFDAVVASRLATGLDSALGSIRGVQALGKPVFLDYDDAVLDIPEHNPVHGLDLSVVRSIVGAAHGLIVTNDALAATFRPFNSRITVQPNRPRIAAWPTPRRDGSSITIGLTGSDSHRLDWDLVVEPMCAIREKYPEVNFILAGYAHPRLAPLATDFVEWVDIAKYPRLINRIDIGLCPLVDDRFNRCKSPIKAYELGMAGAAVVGSPTQYRTVLQGRGTVATTAQEWFDGIERYIVNAQLRQQHADGLSQFVRKLDIDRNIHDVAAIYRKLYQSAKRGT